MSMMIEDDEIKLEPESDEDHDIELEPEGSDDQDIKQEPESHEDHDIKQEPESHEDHDIKQEPESHEDHDIELVPEINEDQEINQEPESDGDHDIELVPEINEGQDIKLEPESNEDQDINLEMESNEGEDIKLERESKGENEIQNLQTECQQKLRDINKDKKMTSDYTICGKPNFKDKSKSPAPDNEHTILMRQPEIYDFSAVNPVTSWTDKEKSKFLNVLLKMSQEKKKMELNSKIAAVTSESKGRKISSTNKKKISTLKRQIDKVDNMELKDLALPLDEEYDWDCVANKLSHRHKPLEYKVFWKLYLHPSLNKAPWSTSEHSLLLKIASEEKLQNWKKIASLLGTGRTSFQCFVYFCANECNPLAGKKWTTKEEEYLIRIVEYYKTGDYIPWGEVAAAMDNRTKIQLYNKYFRLIEFRKGRFLKEEDEVILICNKKFGANFKKMAKYLPGRSSAQCRNRFQILIKKCVSTVWNIDEDRKLSKFISDQTSSVNYSGIAQHFPDKNRQHIRSRYITLKKWMSLNPNVDVAKAPRRASRDLGHGVISHDLKSAVKRLKTRIKAEVNEMNNINMNSAESDIDDTIKEMLFQEEHEEIEEAKCHALISSDGSDQDQDPLQFNKLNVQNLIKCLTLLRATLDRNKFLKCPLSEKCKSLLEPDQDLAPVIKLKSYSRKKPETIVKVGSAPDIWGTKCLPPPTYVLPPNYSTITALRTIMSCTSKESETKEEETNNDKNTPPFNTDEIDFLKKRFNTLLLWPMLLANQPPQGTEPHHFVEQNLQKKP